ncbi:MAG: hypothetical protein KF686_09065 [Ramlibacter sp.]|nr:hypothetical protein [Ramlibacter sp.]
MTRFPPLRAWPTALALLACGLAFNAQAQNTSPTGPGPTSANKAGEAYPNDPNAANKNKPTAEVVQKAENSRPAKAVKRTSRKAGKAVKKTGNRAASAVRDTGNRLARKLPPAKGPQDVKSDGTPKVTP